MIVVDDAARPFHSIGKVTCPTIAFSRHAIIRAVTGNFPTIICPVEQ